MLHLGIDFGAKRAGTTVACYFMDGNWHLEQVAKKKDADDFLEKLVASLAPSKIYMDAPLSLPKVYASRDQYSSSDDFHYRVCDRETGAMSPLFMGGLTARAIRLKTTWLESGIEVYETYPAQLIKTLGMDTHYKKDLEKFRHEFNQYGAPIPAQFDNWHQADAWLAWNSGERHARNENKIFGTKEEGIIIV